MSQVQHSYFKFNINKSTIKISQIHPKQIECDSGKSKVRHSNPVSPKWAKFNPSKSSSTLVCLSSVKFPWCTKGRIFPDTLMGYFFLIHWFEQQFSWYAKGLILPKELSRQSHPSFFFPTKNKFSYAENESSSILLSLKSIELSTSKSSSTVATPIWVKLNTSKVKFNIHKSKTSQVGLKSVTLNASASLSQVQLL